MCTIFTHAPLSTLFRTVCILPPKHLWARHRRPSLLSTVPTIRRPAALTALRALHDRLWTVLHLSDAVACPLPAALFYMFPYSFIHATFACTCPPLYYMLSMPTRYSLPIPPRDPHYDKLPAVASCNVLDLFLS